MPTLVELRDDFHAELKASLWGIRVKDGKPKYAAIAGHSFPVYNNCDGDNDYSVVLGAGVGQRLGVPLTPRLGGGSTSGSAFEVATSNFVAAALDLFSHVQTRRLITTPPVTHFPTAPGSRRRRLPKRQIWNFAQFEHLRAIQQAVENDPQLEAALGGDYLVKPDILVLFEPLTDQELNHGGANVGADVAARAPLRAAVSQTPILHASISCKWTMRRDRAQNTRQEALNLVRNRKGRLPHVSAVTMECDPDILGSLCLGTGDIDCLYHGALPELIDATQVAVSTFGGTAWPARLNSLNRMVNGSRLRDIADLPLDLLV